MARVKTFNTYLDAEVWADEYAGDNPGFQADVIEVFYVEHPFRVVFGAPDDVADKHHTWAISGCELDYEIQYTALNDRELDVDELETLRPTADVGLRDGGPDGTGRAWRLTDIANTTPERLADIYN